MVDSKPMPCGRGSKYKTMDGKKKKNYAKGAFEGDEAARIRCCNGEYDE
jgi:hypothetical protein